MNRLWRMIVVLPAFLLALASQAQTLFTIDGTPVGKDDFLKAYSKNNATERPSEKAYRDYLDLYIRYKLKVKAAYELQLDTLPAQRTDLQNFRTQIAETYLRDETSLDKMVAEAFTRGQQDIHLAHIFISIPKDANPSDTSRSFEKAMAAWNTLKKGKKFAETAAQLSEDPTARTNGGDVGYITVFTLPYDLENLAYSLAPGQYSKPYRTRAGYHIFKNLGARPAVGKIRAAQILIAFPPGADIAGREATRLKADSIYRAIRKGADFAKLARSFSSDNLSWQNGGEIAEFGVGRYDSAFEATAFGLAKDGDISAPVQTSFGWHIIRRIERKPFPRQSTPEALAELRTQVQADPRVEVSRKALFEKIFRQTEYQRRDLPENELWAFADSNAVNPGLGSWHSLNWNTVIFSFTHQQYTIKDWLDYLRTIRPGIPPGRSNPDLFQQYVKRTALDYYRNHLEDFNKDFAFQLTEFKEGNLLFEIMQRKIWDKASTDSAGLHNYFDSHKDKYWWEPSADAILFTCNSRQTADGIRTRLTLNPAAWKDLGDSASLNVQADSARYELSQIPSLAQLQPAPGLTTPVTAGSDNAFSFAYIVRVYPDRAPRNYHDARGFVINDYQGWLEDQWIATLRKKYPVKIDESILKQLGP